MILAAAPSTPGPSVTVGGWVAWIIIAGALALAATAVWKVAIPLARAANRIIEGANRMVEVWHILEEIAQAFRPNGRPSLPDTVHKISATQDELTGKLDDVAEKVRALRHDVIDIAALPNLAMALGSVPTVVGAISRLTDEVKTLRASGGSTP